MGQGVMPSLSSIFVVCVLLFLIVVADGLLWWFELSCRKFTGLTATAIRVAVGLIG